MHKRGIQLSLNMIIIVILALVFLGTAIWLMQKWIPTVPDTPDVCEIYPPTSASPVCAPNEIELSRGKDKQVPTAFYNDEDGDIAETILPTITCSPSTSGDTITPTAVSPGKLLTVGESADYLLIVKVPKDAPRGTYSCNLRLSQTQESVAIVVS